MSASFISRNKQRYRRPLIPIVGLIPTQESQADHLLVDICTAPTAMWKIGDSDMVPNPQHSILDLFTSRHSGIPSNIKTAMAKQGGQWGGVTTAVLDWLTSSAERRSRKIEPHKHGR